MLRLSIETLVSQMTRSKHWNNLGGSSFTQWVNVFELDFQSWILILDFI